MGHRDTFPEMLGFGAIGLLVLLGLSSIPAWITHCATLIIRLVNHIGDPVFNAILLATGAIIAPIGVIHGWLIWFGLA